VFHEVFIADEVNAMRRGIRRYHNSCTNSLGGSFLNMSPRYACFIDEIFSGNKQNFWYWDYSPTVPDYQDF